MTINLKNQTLESVSITLSSSDRALNKSQERRPWETLTTPDCFSAAGISSVSHINPSCEAFTFFNKYTLLSRAPPPPPMPRVNECACLSALIVNETFTQIQAGQIFTVQPRRFITDKICHSSGCTAFLYFQRRSINSGSDSSGLDECGATGVSVLLLTCNECDFNLNHMNPHLAKEGTKYI